MREWVAISISAITLLILVAGGVFFFGHLDEQVQRVDKRVERMEPKLDDVREEVAYIKGRIAGPPTASR